MTVKCQLNVSVRKWRLLRKKMKIERKRFMAKVFLKDGTKLESVVKKLKKKGYVVGRQTPDGAFVIYKKRRKEVFE